MNTVNVIEIRDGTSILSLRSREDTPEGNREAEIHFVECIMENDNDDPSGTPTVEACIENGLYECGDYKVFLVHSTGAKMGNEMQSKLPTECDVSAMPVIHAECHSDDHNVEVNFNAARWLNNASDKDIFDLANVGWKNDYPADNIAVYMAKYDTQVGDMFKYIEIAGKRHTIGFECSVINEDEVLAWLKQFRPILYEEIRKLLVNQ